MSISARRSCLRKLALGTLGSVLVLLLSAALVLASSPLLHKLIHTHAGQPHHECAATLLQKELLVSSSTVVVPVVRLFTFIELEPMAVNLIPVVGTGLLPLGRDPPSSFSA